MPVNFFIDEFLRNNEIRFAGKYIVPATWSQAEIHTREAFAMQGKQQTQV
jgi:hypothetical protein